MKETDVKHRVFVKDLKNIQIISGATGSEKTEYAFKNFIVPVLKEGKTVGLLNNDTSMETFEKMNYKYNFGIEHSEFYASSDLSINVKNFKPDLIVVDNVVAISFSRIVELCFKYKCKVIVISALNMPDGEHLDFDER